jgi:hypothetical protein
MPSPIKIFVRDGKWVVDYGSYAHGYHLTRVEAIKTARLAAHYEHRELVIEAEGVVAGGRPALLSTTRPPPT